jgi:hypothetical protein
MLALLEASCIRDCQSGTKRGDKAGKANTVNSFIDENDSGPRSYENDNSRRVQVPT